MNRSRLVLVTPCFNEDKSLSEFMKSVSSQIDVLTKKYPHVDPAIIMIDDGSTDGTWNKILKIKERYQIPIVGLRFSRNFGHQSAICAGLDYAHRNLLVSSQDTVVIMDSDGQHPPELLPQLFEARLQGYHHVQMLRFGPSGSWFKRISSVLFYEIFRGLSGLKLPSGAADFRAFSGHFLSEYLRFNETIRFNRGLFQWLGFKTKFIRYEAGDRIAGRSSYTFWRMMKFAGQGITYFSSKPLIFATGGTTLIGFLFCFAYGIYSLIRLFQGASFAPGWPTVIFTVTLWGSLISFGQLLLAFYVARIFDETKKRPIYILESIMDERQNNDQSIRDVVEDESTFSEKT